MEDFFKKIEAFLVFLAYLKEIVNGRPFKWEACIQDIWVNQVNSLLVYIQSIDLKKNTKFGQKLTAYNWNISFGPASARSYKTGGVGNNWLVGLRNSSKDFSDFWIKARDYKGRKVTELDI